jgi:voltage-gated potassium channel
MSKLLVRRLGFYLAASALFMLAMVLCFTVFYHFVEGLDWLDSFYFTVITTRTIGFGDISPQTDAGKLGTILNALVPATIFL